MEEIYYFPLFMIALVGIGYGDIISNTIIKKISRYDIFSGFVHYLLFGLFCLAFFIGLETAINLGNEPFNFYFPDDLESLAEQITDLLSRNGSLGWFSLVTNSIIAILVLSLGLKKEKAELVKNARYISLCLVALVFLSPYIPDQNFIELYLAFQISTLVGIVIGGKRAKLGISLEGLIKKTVLFFVK